jgi:hypothetical protein
MYPAKAMKAQLLEKTGNILLPPARGIYLALITPTLPRGKGKTEKDRRWESTFLFPPKTDFTALEAKCNEIVDEEIPPKQKGKIDFRWPILKTAEIKSLAGLADDLPITLRANSRKYRKDGAVRRAPEVVTYPDGRKLTADEEAVEIYAGRWYRATVNPYWYPGDDGKPGISLGLVNVQVLKHDEPLAGAAASAASEFQPSADLDDDEDPFA